MAWVYIIKSEDSKYYIGSTVDIEKRLKRHNTGTGGSTTKGRSWSLVYNKEYNDLADARIEEKRIKSFKGGNAFKRLVKDQPN